MRPTGERELAAARHWRGGLTYQEYGGVEGIGIKEDAGKVSGTAVLCVG